MTNSLTLKKFSDEGHFSEHDRMHDEEKVFESKMNPQLGNVDNLLTKIKLHSGIDNENIQRMLVRNHMNVSSVTRNFPMKCHASVNMKGCMMRKSLSNLQNECSDWQC